MRKLSKPAATAAITDGAQQSADFFNLTADDLRHYAALAADTGALAAHFAHVSDTEADSVTELNPVAPKRDRVADRIATMLQYRATAESNRVSVPIKAAAGFKATALHADGGHYSGSDVTPRACFAVATMLLASGQAIADGVIFPRRFIDPIDSIPKLIENGAGNHAIGCGLIKLAPDSIGIREIFLLAPGAAAIIQSNCGDLNS